MRRSLRFALLSLSFALCACGKTSRAPADIDDGVQTPEDCEIDAECGGSSCVCGSCREPCGGATLCETDSADSCVDPPSMPAAPTQLGEQGWDGSHAHDLVVNADGSASVVGTLADSVLWVANLPSSGEQRWEFFAYSTAGRNEVGRSLALVPGGELLTLSVVDDDVRGPHVRRIDAKGFETDQWWALASASPWGGANYVALRSNGNGPLWAIGSEQLGAAGSTAWIGRFDDERVTVQSEPSWQVKREGNPYGKSALSVAALDDTGNVVVGGYLSDSAANEDSTPYLARIDPNGNLVWEATAKAERPAPCRVAAVAFTADGGSLAAANCFTPWLRAYDASGALQWERRPARPISAVAGLSDGGYLVALGNAPLTETEATEDATLQRYDASHRLVWEQTEPGCSQFAKLVETKDAIVTLANCPMGYRIRWLENTPRFVIE